MPANSADKRLRNREKQLFQRHKFIADRNGNARIHAAVLRRIAAPVTPTDAGESEQGNQGSKNDPGDKNDLKV